MSRLPNPALAAAALALWVGSPAVASPPVPEAPKVILRNISATSQTAVGQRIPLNTSTTLFLPPSWHDTLSSAGAARLTIHFHGAPWFAIGEHVRRGAPNPLLAIYQGEGSTVYKRIYPGPGSLDEQLTSVTAILRANGAPPDVSVGELELQSFSAGYGSVREILRWPEYAARIRAVVLADSLYASATTDTEGRRRPDPDQMAPFIAYARRARDRDVTMIVAHSSIATPYCSTVETADAIAGALGLAREAVTSGSLTAATGRYPLDSRIDAGGLHIWGYGGADAGAHMAVARTVADFWRVVEGRPPLGDTPALTPAASSPQ